MKSNMFLAHDLINFFAAVSARFQSSWYQQFIQYNETKCSLCKSLPTCRRIFFLLRYSNLKNVRLAENFGDGKWSAAMAVEVPRPDLLQFSFLSPSETSVIKFTTIFVRLRALFLAESGELMKSAYLIACMQLRDTDHEPKSGGEQNISWFTFCVNTKPSVLRVRD